MISISVAVENEDILCLENARKNGNYANNLSHDLLSSSIHRSKVFGRCIINILNTKMEVITKKHPENEAFVTEYIFSEDIVEILDLFDHGEYTSIQPFTMVLFDRNGSSYLYTLEEFENLSVR